MAPKQPRTLTLPRQWTLELIGLVPFAGHMWAMRGNDAVVLTGPSPHLVVLVCGTAAPWMHGG